MIRFHDQPLPPVEGLYCKRPIQCLASSKLLTPPPPHRPASLYPPAFGAGGGHTRWVERGGGSIARKTPNTALYSLYVSTLCFRPSLVSKLPLFLSLPVCRRSSLPTGWGGGVRGAESFDRKKNWPSINRSILFAPSLHRQDHYLPPSPSPLPPLSQFLSLRKNITILASTSSKRHFSLPKCRFVEH
jgi:hypothetical protein